VKGISELSEKVKDIKIKELNLKNRNKKVAF
jgi:hypothetical protein